MLTVTRDGDRLFAQATGQPKLEVFAKSERQFFYKAVDAQISFVVDKDGRISSLGIRTAWTAGETAGLTLGDIRAKRLWSAALCAAFVGAARRCVASTYGKGPRLE